MSEERLCNEIIRFVLGYKELVGRICIEEKWVLWEIYYKIIFYYGMY